MDRQKHKEFMGWLEACRKPLMNYIRYNLWNKEQLEDGFQNTVLEGWRKFASFSGDEKWFRAWMFHIANNVVRNLNRAYIKAKEAPRGDEVAPETPQAFDSLPSVLDTMEDKVKESVTALPDNEREVFLLRSVGEFSYEEIAKIMDIPMGSVMGYLARARTKLKEKLYEYAREYKYI
ncbi:MAG: RNA polymerase sigma factor [Planctomycetota bacterium]